MSLSNIKVNNTNVIGIDDVPILSSDNLVKNSGIKRTSWIRPENTNFLYRKNLFEGTWEWGTLGTSNDNMGKEFPSTEICRTNFMQAKEDTDYVFLGFRNSSNRLYDAYLCYFYDKDKKCIDAKSSYEARTVHAPSNTQYMRIITRIDGGNYAPAEASQECIKMTLVEGTTAATEYISSDETFSNKLTLPEYDNKIDEVIKEENADFINFASKINCVIEKQGNYTSGVWIVDRGSHFIIPINAGDKLIVLANQNYDASFAFIKNYDFERGIEFCNGITEPISLLSNYSDRYIAPNDVKYVYFRYLNVLNQNCYPDVIDINGVNYAGVSEENKKSIQIKEIPFVCGIWKTDGGIEQSDNYSGIVGTWVRTREIMFMKAGSYILTDILENVPGNYYFKILKYNSDNDDDVNSIEYENNYH